MSKFVVKRTIKIPVVYQDHIKELHKACLFYARRNKRCQLAMRSIDIRRRQAKRKMCNYICRKLKITVGTDIGINFSKMEVYIYESRG